MKISILRKTLLVVTLMVAVCTSKAQSFWEPVKGPYTSSLWAMKVTSDGTYFAGTGDGRVMRKLPNEDTWRLVLQTPEYQTILSFCEYEGMVWVGDAGGTLMVTADNGDSWESAAKGINVLEGGTQIRSLLPTPIGLLAGTASGIYKKITDTDTGGIAWETLNFNTPRGKWILSMEVDENGYLYAGTAGGLYVSKDNGNVWTAIGFTDTNTAIFSIEAANGKIYIGTGRGLYVRYADAEDDEWTTLAKIYTLESATVRNVTVIGSRIYASITTAGLYYSDNDEDWVKLPYNDARAGVFKDGDKLVAGTDEGVWTSSLANPLNDISQIGVPGNITFLSSSHSKLAAVSGGLDLFRTESPREDNDWDLLLNGHALVNTYAEDSEGKIYTNLIASGTNAPLLAFKLSLDQPGFYAAGFPSEVTRMNQILITEQDSVYIATNAGLYYLNSATENITRLSKVTLLGKEIITLAEDADGNIYAGTTSGFYVSYDYGKTWSVSKLVAEDAFINEICITGVKKGFVATSKGLYHFSDLTSSPELIGSFIDVTSVQQDDHGHLYMVSEKTVYYADDETARWEEKHLGLEGLIAKKLRVVDNNIYVATNGGLYKHEYATYTEVTLSGLGTFTYDGSAKIATAQALPNGLQIDITYNGKTVAPTNPGTYKVKAIVIDDTYVGRAYGEIKIGGIPANVLVQAGSYFIYDGTPRPATASTDPQGLSVLITYNDDIAVPVNAGQYIVKAVIDNMQYSGTDYDTIVIDKAQQSIAFDDISDKLTIDGPVTLNATSSVGLPIKYTLSEGPATLEGNVLHLNGNTGRVVVNAIQEGNINYYSANTKTQTFYVWKDVIMGTENPIGDSFEVFPVPANDIITIQGKEDIKAIRIINTMGMAYDNITFKTPSQKQAIRVSHLAQGMFLLYIETVKNQVVVKPIQVIK